MNQRTMTLEPQILLTMKILLVNNRRILQKKMVIRMLPKKMEIHKGRMVRTSKTLRVLLLKPRKRKKSLFLLDPST